MPFYPELPAPHPMSGLGGMATGWGAAQDLQTQTMKQQMLQQQLRQQQQYMEALKTAQQTGDTSGLAMVAPEAAVGIQKAKQFQQDRALEYTYQMADQMKKNPAIIPQVRAKLKQMGVDDTMFPPNVTNEDIDAFKTNFEKMRGIKSGTVDMYSPTGQPLGKIPYDAKIAPMGAMPTTYVDPSQVRPGVPYPPNTSVMPYHEPKWFAPPDDPGQGRLFDIAKGERPPQGWVPQQQVHLLSIFPHLHLL